MVSRCMTSTSFTKGARPIRASTRASGSAQPGWMYTRIPDSTQDTASCAVTSLLRYCSIQDIYPNPFLSSKPKPFPISRSSRRWHARAPARRSKWQDERTCPAFPTVPSRRKSLPDAPVQRVFASRIAVGPDLFGAAGMVRIGKDEEHAAARNGVVLDYDIEGRAGRVLAIERDIELVLAGMEFDGTAGYGRSEEHT